MTTNLFEAQPTEDSEVGAIEVDENVIAGLLCTLAKYNAEYAEELQRCLGTRVISAAGHGASFWTRTARVDTTTGRHFESLFSSGRSPTAASPTFDYLPV